MLFNSLKFALFFPCVTAGYFILPHRLRNLWLLGCSYLFYMCWNPRYALLMLASTAITWAAGMAMKNAGKARKKRVLARTNQTFGGFIGGKILDSLIIGVLCFIICAVLRIPYALLISVVVGCTNVIPVFGPFLGAIPCAFILLIVNPFSALEFLIMILILQQFDGNVLGPKILGESTGLSAQADIGVFRHQ